jgi:hypothetical protein
MKHLVCTALIVLELLSVTDRVAPFSIRAVQSKRPFSGALHESSSTRRDFLAGASSMMVLLPPIATTAAVGTLPELQDTGVVLQGITVTVADQSQLQSMITFLRNAFDFEVLRQTTEGTVTNTVCRLRLSVNIRVLSLVRSSSQQVLLYRQPSS